MGVGVGLGLGLGVAGSGADTSRGGKARLCEPPFDIFAKLFLVASDRQDILTAPLHDDLPRRLELRVDRVGDDCFPLNIDLF